MDKNFLLNYYQTNISLCQILYIYKAINKTMVLPLAPLFGIFYQLLINLRSAWRKILQEYPVIAFALSLITIETIGVLSIELFIAEDEIDSTAIYIFSAIVTSALALIILVDLISSRSFTHKMEKQAIRDEANQRVAEYKRLLKNVKHKVLFDETLSTIANISNTLKNICKGCRGKASIEEDCEHVFKRLSYIKNNITSVIDSIAYDEKQLEVEQ